MSRYALHSCHSTVATGLALPRVNSPLSELSGELSPDVPHTKVLAEPSTASAQDSAPGLAVSRVPVSGKATLRNPPSTRVQMEEMTDTSVVSFSDSKDDENEVDDSELNIEAQCEVLKNWNQVHDVIQESLDGDQVVSETDNDGFTVVGKSLKQTKASSKSKTSQAKKMVGKSGHYDSLKVEETSDEHPEDPELAEHQKKPKKSKKRTLKKKNVHDLELLASAFDRRIADVVQGKSRAPSSSHNESRHGSTHPMDQLPADSFLADILQVGKSKKKHSGKKKASPERKQKLNKKKSDKQKAKWQASSSDSEPSSSDSSSSDESDSDSDYSYSSPSDSDLLDDDFSPSSSSSGSSSSSSSLDSDSLDSLDSSHHGHRHHCHRWRHGSHR
ncbi:hypothetical protein ARMSODRAFT_1017807 [Armillaria solidipes]|uniref:Uncharacterized protein n=1 Tax=Armillaria solidipes TaxID=1076256 RepID=A0A2H3BJL0_9AGAR|nr:hypothetical protein ARMSODRAFT_1017807 [Armillaria solidipes]